MTAVKLPARVRITRLPGPPGEALLAQLRRLDSRAPLERLAELPSDELLCLAVIAGGKLVGFLLAVRAGDQWHETQVLETTWRGRGIEEALREELDTLRSR